MANDPLAAAVGLRDLIIENRDETEARRQLAEPIVEALIRTKLCRRALPPDIGGLETSPLDALAVYETLAAAEASVAWVVWNSSLVCWFARFLSPDMPKEIYGDPSSLYANSTRPSGSAVADGKSFRITGRWMFFVPSANHQILDTWHVGGLRGTGSHDTVLEDEVVPPRAIGLVG